MANVSENESVDRKIDRKELKLYFFFHSIRHQYTVNTEHIVAQAACSWPDVVVRILLQTFFSLPLSLPSSYYQYKNAERIFNHKSNMMRSVE